MRDMTRLLTNAGLVVAAALVVLLAYQKRDLVKRYDQLNRSYREARTQLLPGNYVPAFQASTLEGQPVTVGELPAEGRQVLLVYTTVCPYCKSSLPAWKQLTAVLDTMTAVRAQVYGVSLSGVDSTRQYAAEHRLPYATVRFPNEKLENMYRAGTVPATLVLDENGRTIYARVGELKAQAAIDSVIAAVKWKPAPRDSAAAPAGQPAARQTASR